MRWLLIRHAQSANNSLPEEQRVEDPPLTPLGHRQAEALGRWLGTQGVARLATSPFRRALETAEYLREAAPRPPDVWIDLHEQGGCYSGHQPAHYQGRPGMSRRQIAERYTHYRLDPQIDESGWWKSRPYESEEQARQRARRVIRDMAERYREETTAFVIHADFKRLLLGELFAPCRTLDADSLAPILNASVTRIDFAAGTPRLVFYNRASHLPPEWLSC